MSKRDERAEWAEDVEYIGPDARLISGDEAAAKGRSILEAALGRPAEVERALCGRPTLAGPKVRGYQSPKRIFRLTEQLDEQLTSFVTKKKLPQSEVMRDALAEYFERHSP